MTAPYYRDDMVTHHTGDATNVLAGLPDASVHCVVTSPPYWGLRDYRTGRWVSGDSTCQHVAVASHGGYGARPRTRTSPTGLRRLTAAGTLTSATNARRGGRIVNTAWNPPQGRRPTAAVPSLPPPLYAGSARESGRSCGLVSRFSSALVRRCSPTVKSVLHHRSYTGMGSGGHRSLALIKRGRKRAGVLGR